MNQNTSSKKVKKTRNAFIRFLTLALIITSAYFALKSSGFFSKAVDYDPVTITKFQNSADVTGQPSYPGYVDMNTVSSGSDENNSFNFSSGITGPRTARTSVIGDGKDKFTVMIYMCGSDLESEYGLASKDIEELKAVYNSDNLNIIIQTGGASEWKNSSVKDNLVERFEVRNGKLKKLASSSTASMTNYSNLTSFVTYCKNTYPANRYALILWGNGGGTSYGFGYDEINPENDSLTADELNLALYSTGVYFDFIGFDAGYMSSYDMAYVMNFYSDYLIASQENISPNGWNYTNWLNAIAENPSIATTEISKIIIDDYIKESNEISEDMNASLTLIDLVDFNNLVHPAAVEFFSSIDTQMSDGSFADVSSARAATREFGKSGSDQIDLMEFAARTGTSEGSGLIDALKISIKYNCVSENLINANGLSLYFPFNNIDEIGNSINYIHRINIDHEYSGAVRKFSNILIGGRASMLVRSSGMDYNSALCQVLNTNSLTEDYSWIDCDFIENCDTYYLNNSLSEEIFTLTGITNESGDVYNIIDFSENEINLITDIKTEVYSCTSDGDCIFFGTDSDELTFINSEKRHFSPTAVNKNIALNKVPVYAEIMSYQEYDSEKQVVYRVPVTVMPASSDDEEQQNENTEINPYSANLYIVLENNLMGNADIYSIAYVERVYENNETKTHARKSYLNEGDVIIPEYLSASVEGNRISFGDTLSASDSITYGNDTLVSADSSSESHIAFYTFEDIYGNIFRYKITDEN